MERNNTWLLLGILITVALMIAGIGVYFMNAAFTNEEVSYVDLSQIPVTENGASNAGNEGFEQVGFTMDAALNKATTVQIDDDVYQLAEERGGEQESFEIYFFATDGAIIVTLLSEPLALARQAAEERLLALTELPEVSLCAAEVVVNTPIAVSSDFAGRDLGLSFCTNYVPLQ